MYKVPIKRFFGSELEKDSLRCVDMELGTGTMAPKSKKNKKEI
jgi:hypothetical protein